MNSILIGIRKNRRSKRISELAGYRVNGLAGWRVSGLAGQPARQPTNKGHTLVEILIVVSIIAILTTLGVMLYYTQAGKSKDSRARANLELIYTQERINCFDEGIYVSAIDTAAVNAALDLKLVDPAFTYSIAAFSTGFTAQAVKKDGSKTFTIDETGKISE